MDERVLLLVLKWGYRTSDLRKLLGRRISKKLDAYVTEVILERVKAKVKYVTEVALALSRISCDSISAYSRPDFSLGFLGQFFHRPFRSCWPGWAPLAKSEAQEDSLWVVEKFPYQLHRSNDDQPSAPSSPSLPSPSLDPLQFQRLGPDLRFSVLKQCSAQTLCEFIGGRIEKEFCGDCERALRAVLEEEVLAIVHRALALDRLGRIQEVDGRQYLRCFSTRLRDFPSPVRPPVHGRQYPEPRTSYSGELASGWGSD